MNKGFRVGLLFMALITGLICALTALLYEVQSIIIIISFVVILGLNIVLWKRKLSKGLLYAHNLLNILGAITFGYLISNITVHSKDALFGLIVGYVAMDVFSFTRRGGFLPNSKLMNQSDMLARLSISLPLPKLKGLFPIIGIGDMAYYSMITMSTLKACGISELLTIMSILFIGQLLNIGCILIISSKKWYKGFPATLMPGVLFLISIITNFIKIN